MDMCLRPIRSMKNEANQVRPHHEGDLLIPCGKCSECLKKRSAEWGMRAEHEMSMHAENSFITLTFDNQNEISKPEELTVEIQKFIKRLRKKAKKKLLYMYSVEYGSKNQRAHYHMLIFGYDFPDQTLQQYTKKGFPIFTSPELQKLWTKGFSSIGSATPATAYYIASYALKNLTQYDTKTGAELKDFMQVSKRPAIGLKYLEKNSLQLVSSGRPLPRYYLKQLGKLNELSTTERQKLLKTDPERYNLLHKFLDHLEIYEANQKDSTRSYLEKRAKIAKENGMVSTSHFRGQTPKSETQKYIENELDDEYWRK